MRHELGGETLAGASDGTDDEWTRTSGGGDLACADEGPPSAATTDAAAVDTTTDVPFVSALVITYNHERYIGEALDSILLQKTTFPFEIIVSEDCSTDRTVEIVESYRERYPGRIQLIRSEVNLHGNEVVLRAVRMARGRYVTFLDGDDYWVSPNKLQVQADFMEAHADSAISYHDVERITDEGEVLRVIRGIGHRGTIDDLIAGNFIVSCSVMLRRSALLDMPDWVPSMPVGDWPLYLLAARFGFVDHVPDIVSRYRVHGESYWATRPLAEQLLLGLCMQIELEAHMGSDYAPLFDRSRRNTARHVLATVLNEKSDPQPEPATDVEKRLQQAEMAVATGRVRLFELSNRINEAEVERSRSEQRVSETLDLLRRTEADRQATQDRLAAVETRAANLSDQLQRSEANAADLTSQLQRSEAAAADLSSQLQRSEAKAADLTSELQRSEAVVADLNGQLHHLVGETQSAGMHGRALQDALGAAQSRLRRRRRREKRAVIGLGLVIAGLSAIILHLYSL